MKRWPAAIDQELIPQQRDHLAEAKRGEGHPIRADFQSPVLNVERARLTLSRRQEKSACMKVDSQAIKRIGASGQISLGKEFAGRTVLVNNPEPGVWLIKTAQTIPDSELWLHEPEAAAQLDRAMAAMDQPPEATDLDALELHLSSR
jgi:hypothetical protein